MSSKRRLQRFGVRLAAAIVSGVAFVAVPAQAAFHLMVIEEVMSGYNGDPDVQYLELRMTFGGQVIVATRKITTFNADGSSFTVFTIPANVTNGANGARILFGTAAFALAAGIAPDFTIASDIITPSGMVCFGSPSDASEPSTYVDCVAYGSYSGPTHPNSGTPTHLPPGDGLNTLGRISETEDNSTDFRLLVPTPRNNANQDGNLGAGGQTTTTTSTTSTSTTGTTTTTLAAICAAAPEAAASCRLGKPGKSRVQYTDKDPGVASSRDRFKWRFAQPLDALSDADFNDPFGAAASYRVCVYDAGVKVHEMDLPSGGLCAGKPCWRQLGSKGFSYKDKDANPAGIEDALFKSGAVGNGQVRIKGRGANLTLPTLPVVGPLVVQLLIDDGITIECFQNEFAAPFRTNKADRFKTKGP